KQPTRPRICQNLCTHCSVSCSCCSATFWSRGCGKFSAQFYFALEQRLRSSWIHHQQQEVSRLTAELKANVGSFQPIHCGRSPGTRECTTGATNHRTAAIAATDSERKLLHRGYNHDALSLIKQRLRNVVGGFENFLKDHSGFFQALGFLLLRQR